MFRLLVFVATAIVFVLAPQADAEQELREYCFDSLLRSYQAIPRDRVIEQTAVEYEPPSAVSNLQFRLAGTAIPGELICANGPRLTGVGFMVLVAAPGSSDLQWAFDVELWEEESFDYTVDLLEFDREQVLSIVSSGRFDLYIETFAGQSIDCAFLLPFAEATVSAACLIVDGDYPLAESLSQWGTAKGMYR